MGRLRPQFLQAHGFDKADSLVETGSQNGLAMERCQSLFPELHTIEISQRLHNWAKKRLKKFPHVHCYLGDSRDWLAKILDPDKSTVVWADAHFVAGGKKVDVECPLMDELAVIFAVPWKTPPTILVDDARMFRLWFWRTEKAKAYDRKQWPSIQRITRYCKRHGYGVRQIGDVLVIEKAA
jgi:hypothetical protein